MDFFLSGMRTLGKSGRITSYNVCYTKLLRIAARVLQGLGASLMMSLAIALVGESIPKEKTGSAMGILGSVSAIGTALGPSLGGLLIAQCSWPMMFLINTPLGILAWLLAYRITSYNVCYTKLLRDADHLGQQVLQVLAADVGFVLGHDSSLSRVEISPSGNPSSRALSNRRMILPLRVFGRLRRKAISRGSYNFV